MSDDDALVRAASLKIRRDLEWRGPSGKTMSHILLPRAQAEAVLRHLEATLPPMEVQS